MRLTFLGAAHEVTGSATLLEAAGKKILIDCGLEQGADIYENCDFPLFPGDIDVVLLTHAHIDHSGKLPWLVANGFKGSIYATAATVKLCNIMLLDSAYIQESEALWRNKKARRAGKEEYVPLYTLSDAQQTLKQFVPCDYEKTYEIAQGVKISMQDAGHLLGSASISVTVVHEGTEKTILFSGDLGNVNRPLIRDPEYPEKADFVVIESTYGDRLHGQRPDYLAQLTRVLQETFDRGGNVVIPCFAVGRTQEILYLMRTVKEQGLIKGHGGFPVYVDSPLAVQATGIYGGDIMEYYDEETLELLSQGKNPILFDDLRVSVTSEESKLINEDTMPKVILSASGMCEAGRIRHHLKHNLWRGDSTILFVGYQSEGSLGRLLIDGATQVKLFGEEINVNAKIETMQGISGHADRDIMLSWLGALKNKPTRVFVNHGDDAVCDTFADTITAKLGFPATAPYNGAVYNLIEDTCTARGNTTVKVKKTTEKARISPAFAKLLAAGNRLMSVIGSMREAANKDIAKLTDQINELCRKWSR